MQNSKIIIVLKVTIALIILWATSLAFYAFSRSNKQQTIEIPSEFNQVLVINSTQVLIDASEKLGTDKNYQPLYHKLLATIKEQQEKVSKEKLGINILKPILFVTTEENGESCRYLIVTITNKEDFKATAKRMEVSAFVKDNKGFIVLLGDFTIPLKFITVQQQSDDFISVYSQNNEKLTFILHESQLAIQGSLPDEAAYALQQIPSSKGLFLQTPFPALKINEKLLPNDWRILVKNVTAIAIDYEGGAFSKQGFYPIINSVFSVQDSLDVPYLKTLIEKNPLIKCYDFKKDNYRIVISGQKYILKKLSDKEWFFGMDETRIVANKINAIFALRGNLSELTNIKGNSLLSASLNFIPGFTPTKRFLNKVESTDITIISLDKQYKMNGKISFKENTNMSLEILDYALEMMKIMDK